MQYRNDKKGNPLSILGYGCMRFSKKGNSFDLAKAETEFMAAVDAGVNYFDTAYTYQGNEVLVGEIVSRNHCREKINIATKLPHYLMQTKEQLNKTFEEQLRRLKTDYIDYYLMHSLTDMGSWNRLKALAIEEWLQEKQQAGQIRNIGFSNHGNFSAFSELVDAYDWDFCLLQYNYADESTQAGRRGVRYASEKNMAVMVMEPLRGGRLVNRLPAKAMELIEKDGRYTPAEWSLRWLWDQPEITTVLSGMNSLEMLAENIKIANDVKMNAFSEDEFAVIQQINEEITKTLKIQCTGCNYCLPCPQHVDIPTTFDCWNLMYTHRKKSGRAEYYYRTTFREQPAYASKCVGCGRCEKACPQHIAIRRELKKAVKDLETPRYRLLRRVAKPRTVKS